MESNSFSEEELIQYLTTSGIAIVPLSKLIEIWPRWDDGSFVGPRPHFPPTHPQPKDPK